MRSSTFLILGEASLELCLVPSSRVNKHQSFYINDELRSVFRTEVSLGIGRGITLGESLWFSYVWSLD